MRRLSVLVFGGVVIASAVQPLAAQQQGAFVLVLSSGDTVAVERFSRTATRLESELLVQIGGARFNISADIAADGSVTRLENVFRQASADPSSTPSQSATITFAGDSAIAVIVTGERTQTQRLASRRGAVAIVNPSFALVEQLVRRARLIGGDTVQVPAFVVQGGVVAEFVVSRLGVDSVLVNMGGVPARFATGPDGAVLGGTVPSQQLRIVRVGSLPDMSMTVPKPDYSAPPDAPYVAVEVQVPTAEGFSLAGTLTVPRAAAAPVPAVVTITGSGPQDRDEAIALVRGYGLFRQVADTLSRHGVAVLRMDDRGFGASGGRAAGATSEDFANDIRAGLAYLRSRGDIDGRRLALVGHSEGALIAPMIAATDSLLRGIVLMAGPSWTGRRVIESQNRFLLETSPGLTAAQLDSLLRLSMQIVDSASANEPWRRYLMAYDPLPTARRVRIPVLILQGETDRQVTADQAEELGAAIREGGNSNVTVRVFPRANHLFLEDSVGHWGQYSLLPDRAVRPDVLGELLVWLIARLR